MLAGSQAVHTVLQPDTRLPLEEWVDGDSLAQARSRLGAGPGGAGGGKGGDAGGGAGAGGGGEAAAR